MTHPFRISMVALVLALPALALKAQPVDPEWPCVQRRQPSLSLAQVWPGPEITPEIEARASVPEIGNLAAQLAARRTPISEAEDLIKQFKADHAPEERAALFFALFTQIQSSRERLLEGIGRYARKQSALEATINESRHRFEALKAATPPDFDAIDRLEREIDWSTRIFIERNQSLTYVCDTPVILEKRAFTLGRALAAGS